MELRRLFNGFIRKDIRIILLVFFILLIISTLLMPLIAYSQEAEPDDNPNNDGSDKGVVSGAKTEVPFLDRFIKSDKPILLQADSITYDNQSRIYTANGRVTITQEDLFISADTILINAKDGSLSADGHVLLENKEGKLTCNTVHLELNSETGVIVRGRLIVRQGEHNYYFTGERIEKVGESNYHIENGTYSSCDCEEGDEADWIIQAKEIDLTLDGYAIIRHGRYIAFGHPVAWIPYGVFPAKVTRQTGFLSPEMGWANDDGYNMGVPFFWAIDQSNDMTIYTNYYENRGLKEGLEYRYAYSQRWKGQFDMDVLGYDHSYGAERWAVSYEHMQNPWRRMYLRSKINFISDNDYVVDFPRDISARYDTFIRSNVILNNLWEDFSFNLDFELYDDLTQDDNAATWQHVPEAKFSSALNPIVAPFSYKFDMFATSFMRDHRSIEESDLDKALGHETPYLYLDEGQRYELIPEVTAPLSFNRYAYFTPFGGGYSSLYYLNERETDQSPHRVLYFTGADFHTELERIFPIISPYVTGAKHSIQPGVSYIYFPDSYPQDELPIFDGKDRHSTENAITYYFDNRLWLKLFNKRADRFHTLKLLDLRLSQDYDFHEVQRLLDPLIVDDELRPFSPVRARLEVLAPTGSWLNRVIFRSDAYYNIYDNRIGTFNVLGAVGSVNEDLLGIEYRYHVVDNSELVDIDYLSGLASYTLFEAITLGAVARYSFIDDYFIERIYSVRFNSLQNCWNLELQLEQREIPENEIIVRALLDLTGLISVATSF